MLLCVVVLLFVRFSDATNAYHIPDPKVNVFSPERFRISIEDAPGVTFVAYHVNINEVLMQQQVGEYTQELFHPVRGRWSFEINNVHLKVGDNVNYWLFVIHQRMGFRKLGSYTIRELQNGSFEASNSESSQEGLLVGPARPTAAPTNTNQQTQLNFCEHFLLNTTQSLLNLQSELEKARKTNEQLTALLKKYPDSTTLTLTAAKIPPNNDPVLTVKYIIREKLDLNPDVVSAVKKNENSIEFKVASVLEKMEILEAAKGKLDGSRFSIS